MADDPIANSLAPGVRNRSTAEGDVPETLRRRYYVDGRGGAGLGFYADATNEGFSTFSLFANEIANEDLP